MNGRLPPTARRAALLALLLAFPAAQAAPRLALVNDAAGRLQIEAQGEWPLACAPQPSNAWTEGRNLYFEVREGSQACKGQAAQPVTLRSAALPLQADDGVYRLHLLGADGGRTLAFALAGGDDAMALPESGLWWPENGGDFESSGPGFGVQIEVQARTLAVNVSGYADSGRPTWWFGAAPLGARHLQLELSALVGGSGPFNDYAAPKQVEAGGQLHIEWLGPARAVFWFARPAEDGRGLQLRPVSMTRFAYALRPGESWAGEWLLLTTPNEGGSRAEVHRFEFVGGDASSFELLSDRGLRLACTRSEQRPDSPPETCRLADSEQSWQLDFREVGLGRLDARIEDGSRVSLRQL
jgi:hypothetical protein